MTVGQRVRTPFTAPFGGAPAGQNPAAFAPGGYYNPLKPLDPGAENPYYPIPSGPTNPPPVGTPSMGGGSPAFPGAGPYQTLPNFNPQVTPQIQQAIQQMLGGGPRLPITNPVNNIPFQNPQNGLGQGGGPFTRAINGGRVTGTPIGANFGAGWDLSNPQVAAYVAKIQAQQAANAARIAQSAASPLVTNFMRNWGGVPSAPLNFAQGPLRTGIPPTTAMTPEQIAAFRQQHQAANPPAGARSGPTY
jgi:hypothetical protein